MANWSQLLKTIAIKKVFRAVGVIARMLFKGLIER